MNYDFIIIGGGIVGLSTAWQLQRDHTGCRILLLEKEPGVARHQSGRNSGVIHAGVYYQPGSLKARYCREGSKATFAFCEQHGLASQRTGKLIVATGEDELERVTALFERCRENRLDPEWLEEAELHRLEPAIRGVSALLIRESGIADYGAICLRMLELFTGLGGIARFDAEVIGISESAAEITVRAGTESFSAEQLVVCSGLQADRLARMQGLDIPFRVIPFRGEYFRLSDRLGKLTRHLIYPVPDPALPFLGVHLTRMIDGSTTVGPNAVQAWKREGYGSLNFSWNDTRDMLGFPGFWKLARKHIRYGWHEFRDSVWKPGYLARVRRYCPRIGLDDLLPYRTGIRAQVVRRDGSLVDDFLIEETDRSLHVCNAPSPAATSAIPIGRHLCDRLAEKTAARASGSS